MRFPLAQTALVYSYIRRQRKAGVERFPLVLMLEPLHACNLECPACGRIREYKQRLSEMLSMNDCLDAVDECGAPVVSICGGEPLLYPQIGELVRAILERRRVVYLCTNGQLLGKKLHLFRPHRLFNINVHLDGMAKIHDAIVERPGAFDRAVAGIKAAKDLDFTVCTNTTMYTETGADEVCSLIRFLEGINIDGILLSPGFDYSDVSDKSVFMRRDEIGAKFRGLGKASRRGKIWSTPLFLDFLEGVRDYPCTPWGNVTYNVAGWKAPCYLITDNHYASFGEFLKEVDWGRYGPGRDVRCANCMVHSGFESTVALTCGNKLKDALRMAWWTLV